MNKHSIVIKNEIYKELIDIFSSSSLPYSCHIVDRLKEKIINLNIEEDK